MAKTRSKRRDPDLIPGETLHDESPDFTPLQKAIDDYEVSQFMWMCAVALEDGTRLEVFKHHATRRYLHLTHDGRAFTYVSPKLYRPYPLVPLVEVATENVAAAAGNYGYGYRYADGQTDERDINDIDFDEWDAGEASNGRSPA